MNKKRILTSVLIYCVLIFAVIAVVFPLAWILSTSIKPATEIFEVPPRWIPRNPTMGNYFSVLFESSIPKAFINSLIIGLGCAFISLVFGGLAGYGFARFKFRFRNALSIFMLISQMLPITVVMIPMYYMIDNVGLIDTKIGITFAHLIIALPMVTWMIRGYVQGIPLSLEEAASIDGCSTLRMLVNILIPLLKPALVATGVYALICSWNEYALANVLSRSLDSKTLPLGLSEFSTFFRVNWGDTMAAAIVITIPVIVFFMAVQKQFVSGLVSGSVKE